MTLSGVARVAFVGSRRIFASHLPSMQSYTPAFSRQASTWLGLFFFFFQNYILTDQPCYSFCIWESLLCVLGTVLSIWMFKTQFYWNIWLIWGWSFWDSVYSAAWFRVFFFIIEMMLCMIDWLNAAMTLHVFLS